MKPQIGPLLVTALILSCSSSQTDNAPKVDAECTQDSECENDNPCTISLCKVGGICEQMPRTGFACEDGDQCTEGEICNDKGECANGSAVELATDPCQTCVCDPQSGISCTPSKEGWACNDGNCCTQEDTCQPCDPNDDNCADHGLKCAGEPRYCVAENECTQGMCVCDDDNNSTCEFPHSPDGTSCDFSPNDCTEGDVCKSGQCIVGSQLPLDDGNVCTKDLCVKGIIQHQPLTQGQCDDGNECTKKDSCVLGTCVGGPTVDCALPECGSSVSCVKGEGCVVDYMPTGADCDDNNPCTSDDACDANHKCTGATEINCNDANPCTADKCIPGSGCVHVAQPELEGVACLPATTCAAAGQCSEGQCIALGDTDCDDQNPCTDDTCDATSGCVNTPNNKPCNDGDRCTATDTCIAGGCVGSGNAKGLTFNCNQQNEIDGDKCCCKKKDPTGAHKSGHVLDLGAVYQNVTIECCLTPGFTSGCKDTAFIDTSENGQEWTLGTSLETSSVPKPEGGWEAVCTTLEVNTPMRFIRGANDKCYVDHFKCTLPCGGEVGCQDETGDTCNDQNPCTNDSCDTETGECNYTAVESNNCLLLKYGNNLVSFGTLPDNPTLDVVFGKYANYVHRLTSEAKLGFRLDGEWVGNLHKLERTLGYWLFAKLPAGVPWISVPLPGAITDPDIKYPLHAGVNSISFTGPSPTPVLDALLDKVQNLFTYIIGQGIATFADGEKWIGSLTQLKINKGYEVNVTEAIPAFQYGCAECDDKTTYTYGCIHPAASNYNDKAQIDNGSCKFALPPTWALPKWGSTKHQAFVVFHKLRVNGQPLADDDAVGAFAGEKGVGFGFTHNDFTVVPVIGAKSGDTIEFMRFDKSTGEVIQIALDTPYIWKINSPVVVVGCMDKAAPNYSKKAAMPANVCQ